MDDIHSRIIELRENLKSDIIKYGQNIAKYMAQDIADDLTKYAKSIIEEFYGQYDPEDASKHNGLVYYYRHWNFRKVPKRYYKKRGNVYTCGVDLNDELPNVYRGTNSSPIAVYNRVMNEGLHGLASLTSATVPTYNPSPFFKIKKKYEEINNDSTDYENKAELKARNDNYVLLFK